LSILLAQLALPNAVRRRSAPPTWRVHVALHQEREAPVETRKLHLRRGNFSEIGLQDQIRSILLATALNQVVQPTDAAAQRILSAR
jgi:hypothetical protein|tara:strand:- start:44 stop:301 length:258 start_codon:yes stop_codon:yes gene_type:complete